MSTITEPASDASLEEKAAFGAADLDLRMPGWYKAINTDDLDLRDDIKCVLGQLIGDFDDGLAHFGWNLKDAELRGFYVPLPDSYFELTSVAKLDEYTQMCVAYLDLTDFWIQEIQARRRADDEGR